MKKQKATAALLALAHIWMSAPSRAEEPAAEASEPVFITLTRTEEPASRMPTNVSSLSGEEIRKAGAITLADALDMLPGVDVLETTAPGQYSTVRLRGVPTSNHVQVLVDDQSLGGVFLQDLDLGQIPVDQIERIELVRGGASVLYGANAVGGIVHIITKKGVGAPVSSIGYEARSLETRVQRAELRRRAGRADISVDLAATRTGGFQKNSDGKTFSANGSFGHSWASGARVSLEANRWESKAGDPQGTAIPLADWNGEWEKSPVDSDARVKQGRTLLRVKGFLPLGSWGSIQSAFHGSNQDYVNENPDPFFPDFSDIDKNIFGNDTRLSLPGRTTLGFSYERDEYRKKGDAKLHGANWGVYAQKIWTAGSVDLMPALRLDQHGMFGNTYNPRLTVVWRAAERVKASANAGRSFRSPTLVDLQQDFPAFSFFSNKQLRPETAWTYDLGVQVGRANGAMVSLTGFHTRLRDRMTATNNPFPASNMVINAPRAEMSGVETELTGRLGALSHRVAHTYQRSMGNSLTSSRYVPLRRTPRHLLNAQASWDATRGWILTAGARYSSRQFENDGEAGLMVPSHTLWNARISKKILGAELYVGGENLTNRRYADAFGFGVLVPQPGRTFWSGMTIRFQD
jgi:vitamin B12 transporter